MKFEVNLDQLKQTRLDKCPCKPLQSGLDVHCPCIEFCETGFCVCRVFRKLE